MIAAGLAIPREEFVAMREKAPLTADGRKQLARLRPHYRDHGVDLGDLTGEELDELTFTVAVYEPCSCKLAQQGYVHYHAVPKDRWVADCRERIQEIRARR